MKNRFALRVMLGLACVAVSWGFAPWELSLSAQTDKWQALAASGQIQADASVKDVSEIAINAAPEKVWQLLTAVNNWPTWQPGISAAHMDGPLGPGTSFTWINGGTEIKSRVALVRPVEQIGWTGVAYKAHAIHLWSLQRLSNGTTLVKTSESMDGFLVSLFYSSKKLKQGNEAWLQALKRGAEK